MVTKNIFAELLARVRGAADALIAAGTLPAGLDQSRVTVEPPRDPTHGDIATNAAMVLAKDAGKKPRDLAEAIAEKLRGDDLVARADVAGPGFINLTLKPVAWIDALRSAVRLASEYGKGDLGGGVPVNVEYVSANPTGPMHVGHGRGAVFGDALANLLAFAGYKVTREYYVNDAGAQVDALARSAYLRYREALGEEIGIIPEGLYPGDYLKPVGALIAKTFGETLKNSPEAEKLTVVRAIALEQMMISIRDDLAALGVSQEHFFYERTLIFQEEFGANSIDHIARTIEWLRERGNVYQGRLPPPRGAPIEDWEDREQTLFSSTAFGD
ncbi:MAG: arginine--tRNA ligase, partial [Xanthobacteraceae bacterium]